MGPTNGFLIFLVPATIIMLLFTVGMVVFVFQYHRRVLAHEKEKMLLNEQHLEEMLNAKLEIQQQTMQDIGREIHDNIGQRLTLGSIYANAMVHEKKAPEYASQIAAIADILNESITELRSLSRNLTNSNADITELKELVKLECNRVNNLNLCKVSFQFNESSFDISNTLKIFILRIIQEFFQNSLKHSRCRNIFLNFAHDLTGLYIQIEDDGIGFDVGADRLDNNKIGIGLSNMKKRADLMGAQFSFTSVINQGTKLSLYIPDQKLRDN